MLLVDLLNVYFKYYIVFFSCYKDDLEKIRRSIRFIKSSTLRSNRLEEIINRDYPDLLKHTKLTIDNNKQWTSTCEMLDNYCYIEAAINAFYNSLDENSFTDIDYDGDVNQTRENIIPTPETMERIKDINQFLSTIYSAYTFVNRSNVLLSSSLVVYDTVIETCEQQYTQNKYPSIQEAIQIFYNKLVDFAQRNNFAATASLIFDPRFKDGYLSEHRWSITEKNNSDAINNYLRDVYDTDQVDSTMPPTKKLKMDKKTVEQYEQYTREPREQNSELFNLIFYWNSHDFGYVNKFAKDLIVIPPSSKELSDCFTTLDAFLSDISSESLTGDEIKKHQTLHHWINGPLNDFSPSKMIYSEDNMNCVNDSARMSSDDLKMDNIPVPI